MTVNGLKPQNNTSFKVYYYIPLKTRVMNKQVQNKALMLRWYDQLWNNGNEAIIDELMHPQCRAFGLGPEPAIGPEGFRRFYHSFVAAYRDIHITIDKNLTDGDYVISLCSVTAVHRGTGKRIDITGTSLSQIENGKVTSAWNHFDFLTMYLQVGAIDAGQLG
jgi:predicted SnoaL-like aldol condensation-catalyzing enzyme